MSTQQVSNSLFQELQSFYQNRTADLKQLGSALQSGDLTQAQQIYNTLVSLGKSGPFGNSDPFANSAREKAFEAVGQALQSGDLAGAQAAFSNLQKPPSADQDSSNLPTPAFIVTITSTQSQPAPRQNSSYFQQRKADLAQLGTALQSGTTVSLQAAQQAYDSLVALGQSGPLKNGATFHRADRAQYFAAIGQALQSGDLAGAQEAFAALQSTFHQPDQRLLGPPTPAPTPQPLPFRPPNLLEPQSSATSGPSGPPEIVINVGGSFANHGGAGEIVVNLQPSANPEDVQISIGGKDGSGDQLTIDVNPKGGHGGEEVSINFNRSSNNYQLVLNLSNSTSAANSSVSLQA